MDAFAADARVGRLTTFLEGSVSSLQHADVEKAEAFGLLQVLPLLAIFLATGAGGAALVARVAGDTVNLLAYAFLT